MNFEKIKSLIKKNGYYFHQDEKSIVLAQKARTEYLSIFPHLVKRSTREPFTQLQLNHSPWLKLAIGSTNGVGDPYAQFLMTTYFAESLASARNISNYFEYLIEIRNSISEVDSDFGGWNSTSNFWNASRIHHYPRGGGFMMEHADTHFPKILASATIPFLQVMGLLSARGDGFFEGGGFIVGRDRQRIFVEDDSAIGRIVMFDGSCRHGVADIDPDHVLNLDSTSGRIAAFVNVYERRD